MSDTLSIDEAVAVVSGEVDDPNPAPVDDSAADSAPTDDGPQGDDNEIPGDQPGSDEAAETPAVDAGGDDDAPVTPAAEAPAHWSAEGKAVFASLPPEAQAAILAEAAATSKVTSKKLEETAAERKAAKAERQRLIDISTQAESVVGNRWSQWTPQDWAALAAQDPQKYTALKAQHDADQAVVQQATAARTEAEAAEHADWLSEQREALKTLSPELLDPVQGEKRLTELGEYITKEAAKVGANVSLPNVGALEMSIARKAMLYDLGVSKLATKTAPASATPALKPSAVDGNTTQQRTEARVKERFSKTGSIDDAVELLIARQG